MDELRIGDIVTRDSYAGDIYFRIIDINTDTNGKKVYFLKGLTHRLRADSDGMDLSKRTVHDAQTRMRKEFSDVNRAASRGARLKGLSFLSLLRSRPGRILHLDSDGEYLDICLRHYAKSGIQASGRLFPESEQPGVVRQLLDKFRPDILVTTGHDAVKKGTGDLQQMENYRNSKYYVEVVKIAREYQPSMERLCIFAGACQSYYEALINAGANFASSPGRVLINVLDPVIVSEKIALTDRKLYVTPEEVSLLTVTGKEGVWGVKSKGQLMRY